MKKSNQRLFPVIYFQSHWLNYVRFNLKKRRRCFLVFFVFLCFSSYSYFWYQAHKPLPYADMRIYADSRFVCRSTKARPIFPLDRSRGSESHCYNANGKTIQFVQLTNWTDLDMCGIVTAAVKNPNFGVCVLQPPEIFVHKKFLQKFSEFPNIHIMTLDIEKILEGTVLFDWHKNVCSSKKDQVFIVAQVADALRWVYLYKYGGVSLDTDTLTLKSFQDLRNTISLWYDNILNNAVLVMDKGHDYLLEVIETFPRYVSANKWGTSSYFLMTHVFEERQKRLNGSMEAKADKLNIAPFYTFYPPVGREPEAFLASTYDRIAKGCEKSYTFHLFRGMFTGYWTGDKKAEKSSFVGRVFQKYCA